MKVAILASGSAGNSLVVEGAGTRLLIDCGLSVRCLRQRLSGSRLDLDRIDALLLTHEHGDHVRGLEVLRRRFPMPVLATAGTALEIGLAPEVEALVAGREVTVGGIVALPVATSHDAREPVGFVLDDGRDRVGVVTDTGVASPELLERLAGCSALFLECNHDPDMLRLGPYPWPLKQRIASRTGHLSNWQCRDAVEVLAHDRLELVVAMHLSRENNLPGLVRQELSRVLAGSGVRVAVAAQDEVLAVEVGAARATAAAAGGGRV